jgi:hypothetical protein
MAIIDNTLAAQTPTFDPATPLAQAAKLQAAEQDARQNQFKQAQLELGTEARGLAAVQNSPEFPKLWAEASDRMLQKGLLTPQAHQQWRNTPSPLLLKQMIAQTEDPTLQFRKQEALRDQGNTDRSFGLQKTNADRNFSLASRAADRADEGAVDEADDRAQAGAKYGLSGPALNNFALGGGVASGTSKIEEEAAARERMLKSRGQDPSTPQNQQFISTGKYPREDAQPLTATDKKAILEADEGVMMAKSAIDALQKATDLSSKAFAGPMASGRGYAASFLGETSDLGKGGIATAELNNVVTTNALSQLKAIFGGAPTEGERKILLDIQGSVNQPHEVRTKIYERAKQMAERRLKFNEQRAAELRSGSFYKANQPAQGASGPTGETTQIPSAAIEALKSNPALKADFEAKYGAGTAAVVLR